MTDFEVRPAATTGRSATGLVGDLAAVFTGQSGVRNVVLTGSEGLTVEYDETLVDEATLIDLARGSGYASWQLGRQQ